MVLSTGLPVRKICELTLLALAKSLPLSTHLVTPEAHDLEAFNSGSELGFFEFKIFLIWM